MNPASAMKDSIVKKFIDGSRPLQKKIKAIYLFGSRARGTERPDSDYDLFLVVANNFTLEDKSRLYDGVLDILLETGHVVSLKIFKESEFQKLRDLGTPFTRNVLREGIKIG